jgi:hypothetical protein
VSRALGTALFLAIASIFLRQQFISFDIGDHPDEKIIAGLAERAVRTGTLTANWEGFPSSVWWSRPTYQFSPYTLLENALAIVSNRLSKWPATWEEHVVFARWFSVVVGGIAVFWCYLAAMAWFNDVRIALVAELFLAVAFLHVQDTSYGRVEALLSLAVLVAYWASGLVMNRPSIMRCLLLGVSIGVAIAVKYNAAPVVLLSLAPFFAVRREPTPDSSFGGNLSRVLLIGGGAVIGFVMATPEVLVRPGPLVEGIQYELNHYSEGHPPHQAFDASDNNARFWWNYLSRLGFGWFPTLAAIGFALAAIRFRGRHGLLAIALAGAFAVLLVVKVRFERNGEIALGPMCVAAAAFVVWAWDLWSSPGLGGFARIVIVVGVVGNVVQHSMAFVDFHRQQFRSSSPLHMIPVSAREANVMGQAIMEPPRPNWREYSAFLLYGWNDPFSRRGLAEWRERLEGWDVVVIEAPWYTAGYPFSTVETYHGPGFVLRAARKRGAAP